MTTPPPAHAHDPALRELVERLLDTAPGDTLTELAAAERLSRRLADLRWATAWKAVHDGAGLAAVAAALGEDDVEWLPVAMTAWADQQLHDGHLDRAGYDRLTAPLAGLASVPAAVA